MEILQIFDDCLEEDTSHQSLTGKTELIDAILLSTLHF